MEQRGIGLPALRHDVQWQPECLSLTAEFNYPLNHLLPKLPSIGMAYVSLWTYPQISARSSAGATLKTKTRRAVPSTHAATTTTADTDDCGVDHVDALGRYTPVCGGPAIGERLLHGENYCQVSENSDTIADGAIPGVLAKCVTAQRLSS